MRYILSFMNELSVFTEVSNSFIGSVRNVTELMTPNVQIPDEIWVLEH